MKLLTLVSCLVAVSSAQRALAAPGERWLLLSTAGPIGSLTVTTRGDVVDTDFRVDDNGRGSKLKEHIELGKGGRPKSWRITGRGWFGAPVDEQFEVVGERARWKSLDDAGEAAAGGVYLPNNGTPWTHVLLLEAALAAKDKTLATYPGGSVRLEKVRAVKVGAKQEKLTAYALWGMDVAPTFVLARGNRLVALLDGWRILVEPQYGDSFRELAALTAELATEALARLSKRLMHPLVGPTWLTNVRVFDPFTKSVGEPTNVVVHAGVITGVRKDAPPADAAIVDGGGGTLLPGLFDAHGHSWDWGGPLNLAAGVTFVRDPGNVNEMLLGLEPRIEAGELIGPRIRKSGFLEGKSPYSAMLGFVIGTLDEALAKVRWYADHGYWGIKIYNSMTPDWVKPIAAEAHRLGLHVSGHVPAFMSSERAIRDGYDEINHVNQLLLSLLIDVDKEDTRTPFRFTALGERCGALDLAGEPFKRLVALMKEKKTVLDTTLATFGQLLLSRPGQAAPTDANWIDHMPVTIQRGRRSSTLDVAPAQYPLYDAAWKKLEAVLLHLHRAGIQLVPGTDDLTGVALHSELEAWVKAGIPAADALALATLEAARFVGMEAQVGSVTRGKLADLYLVDGDPTQDINAIRKGRLVIKGNVAYYPDEIYTALGVKPFAARAEVKRPPATRAN